VVAYCVDGHGDSTADDDDARNAFPQKLFGGIGIGLIALGCGWTLYANLLGTRDEDVFPAPAVTVATARPDAPAAAPRKRSLLTAPVFDIALIDSTRSLGLPPVAFSQSAPLKSALQAAQQQVRVVQSVPMPAPRPAGLGSPVQAAAQGKAVAAAADNPFEKLFGKPRESGPALAYAAPDGGVFNDGQGKSPARLPPNDGQTAIYDIAARTVHLPDGTRLEAHSGLGPKMDDPRYVHVKMHGATPPHVYDLAPREALFHGVEALRMHPVGGAEAIHGRAGLLTHNYLLGPNGQSNGCVSFKDYDVFLRAYKDGKVKRMIVVASLDDPQLDLRILDRPPARIARAYSTPAEPAFTPIADDRYALSFRAARASRTNSSARSLNSSPE
jgi:hypothetical protein